MSSMANVVELCGQYRHGNVNALAKVGQSRGELRSSRPSLRPGATCWPATRGSSVCEVPAVVAAGAVAQQEVALGVASPSGFTRRVDPLTGDGVLRVDSLGQVGEPPRPGPVRLGAVRRAHRVTGPGRRAVISWATTSVSCPWSALLWFGVGRCHCDQGCAAGRPVAPREHSGRFLARGPLARSSCPGKGRQAWAPCRRH
jgi:hypothetical protein